MSVKIWWQLSETAEGQPAIWEKGGADYDVGYNSIGTAKIITGASGERLEPEYVVSGQKWEQEYIKDKKQVRFEIKPGYFVVSASRFETDISISIYRIKSVIKLIKENGDHEWIAEVELKYRFKKDEWKKKAPKRFREAIEAAIEKTNCYRCGCSHYYIQQK